MFDWLKPRPLLRNLLPGPIRDRYHRYALRRDFGIDRNKGTRRPTTLRKDLPEGLNLIGYFESVSGVGQSARALASAAERAGVPVARLEVSGSAKRSRPFAPYDVNLYHVNADGAAAVVEELGPGIHAGRANVAYWYWEAEEFPERWRDRFDYFDEIWVASEYCRRAIEPVSPVPIAVIPPAVTLPEALPDARERLGLAATEFLFLTVFDAMSVPERKNPLGTIRAFARAFPIPSDARLLIRVWNAAEVPGLMEAMRQAAQGANVSIEEGEIGRDRLALLFAACDGYVSLHRAEGFGFPIAEAMSLGKPVVATDYSGSADYLDETTGFPVRWRPMSLPERIRDYDSGTRWAEPEEEHAIETLRRVFQDRSGAARRGEAARRRIAELYAPAAVGKRVRLRLENLKARLLRGGPCGPPNPLRKQA